ncbi:MAG TPA: penicillin-binding transpeptidase domain-containing protein, partial [Ktedonobacterales bacterium]
MVNMNVTIRRLSSLFIILLLFISGVAAYVQIVNQAFINGPVLAQGDFDPRRCPPNDAPLRGRIYDRNGTLLAESVPDPKAICGYTRKYSEPSLAPLIGYFSYRYGTAGIERTFNKQLSGVDQGNNTSAVDDAKSKILRKPRYGQDITLTIDVKLQQAVNKIYDTHASGGVCQPNGTTPPGSIIVEKPDTGEILAMVSRPFFDPNKIDQTDYFAQLQNDPGKPLLNHATQAVYAPGSTFKTVTMIGGLEAGTTSLDKQFSQDEAVNYVINGEPINWDDYLHGYPSDLQFPMTLEQGYAYSDNVAFAREAVTLGKDKWLSTVRKFGIQTPGTDSDTVPFDGPYAPSTAYSAVTNGKPTDFSQNLLAESGFGQGQLLISPLTMASVVSAVAANGKLYIPHVVGKTQPHSLDAIVAQPQLFGGDQIFSADTASKVRQAMWSVTSYGTASTVFHNGIHLADSPVKEGGKTGTAQLENGLPHTWWISLAPDDQAPGGSAAQLA